MRKKGIVIAVLLACSILFSSAAFAESCCLNLNSPAFCRGDKTAADCCGSDSTCIATKYLGGVNCSSTGKCFSGESCCLDDCTSSRTNGYETPLKCSDESYYVPRACSNYSECYPPGCAICEGDANALGSQLKLKNAIAECQKLGKRLSVFNTTADCSLVKQNVAVFYSVSGTVVSAGPGNPPVAGASVTIAGSTGTTNSSGDYKIDYLPFGTYTARAVQNNYFENLTSVNIDGNKTGVNISLVPIATANLTVNVTNATGNPVASANVTADSTAITTDAEGLADFVALPKNYSNGLPRPYTIRARFGAAENYTVTILPQPVNIVRITLPEIVTGTGSIEGYVMNASGALMSGVTLAIAGQINKTAATDQNGHYSFTGMPAGTYDISIIPPAPYIPQTGTVVIPAALIQQNFTVQLSTVQNLGTLVVFVADATTAAPISGAEVTITQAGAALPFPPIFTAADGTASKTLVIGNTYQITVRKSGYQDAGWTGPLNENQTVNINMLTAFLPQARIYGKVVDSINQSPIEGVAVSISPFMYSVTNSNGDYSINNVPQLAYYMLTATKTGYNAKTEGVQMLLADVQHDIFLQTAECFSEITPPEITALRMQNDMAVLSFETPCAIKGYYVYRCEGKDCVDTKPVTNMIGPQNLTFADEKIEPEKWYTYEIHAYFESPFVQEKISAQKSIYTGARECFKLETDEFCHNNIRSNCTENNTIGVVEPANSSVYCMQDGMKTKYVDRVNCSLECNKPLGMFSFLGKLIVNLPGGAPEINCSSTSLFSSLAYCYHDYAKTVVSMYYSCEGISSCYDYFSEDACKKNTCKLSGQEGCVWRSYSSDLSLGVCMPREKRYWNCSRCDPSNKFNNLFGTCNREICDLYGGELNNSVWSHYCYFINNKCQSREILSCEHYGTDSELCLDNGQNVSVNTAGLNEITYRSKDLLDFGLCRFGANQSMPGQYLYWNRCFKDANNDYNPDRNPADMSPPYTVVIHPTASSSINFPVEVYDDENNMSQPVTNAETYFQVSNIPGAFVRPSIPARNGFISGAVNVSNKNYTVWFYSKDYADNLEIAKSFNVYIDFIPPQTSFGYSYDTGTSTLTTTISSAEDIACSAALSDDTGAILQPLAPMGGTPSALFSEAYDVSDGVYNYNYECRDWVNNNISGGGQIVIDTEGMIYNPQPNSTIKDESVAISVQTKADAICKYYDVPINPDGSFERTDSSGLSYQTDMVLFDETGGKTHSATQTIANDSIAKMYLVKCLITDTGNLTKSNISAIRFTVDRLAPETKIYEPNTLVPIDYNLSVWRKQASFVLKCKDPPSPAIPPYFGYLPIEFGCKQLYYCVNYSDCTPQPVNATNGTNLTAWIVLNESKKVCFQSEDNGGNMQDTICELIKIDRTSPRVKITANSGKCSDETGSTVCRVKYPNITLGGTVGNAAYWADRAGGTLPPYFTDFNFTAVIKSDESKFPALMFDYLGQDSYDTVQFSYATKEMMYGNNNAYSSKPVNIAPNTPFNLTIEASAGNADIFINGIYQASLTRTNPGGWIILDNFSFSDIIVYDATSTSDIAGNLSVIINGNETATIPIINGGFSSTINLGGLYSQFIPAGFVELSARDVAGNIGKDSIFVFVDQIGPLDPIVFDPPITNAVNHYGENYNSLEYPMHYEGGKYYTGGGILYLTGYTTESGERIEFWVNETEMANFTQNSSADYVELEKTFEPATDLPKGTNKVYLAGNVEDAVNQIGSEKYATFSGHHRTKYGSYGDAYMINSVQYVPGTGTVLELAENLEKDVSYVEGITISNMPRMTDRFVLAPDFGNQTYATATATVYQFDDLDNEGKFSSLQLVLDTIAPKVTKIVPGSKDELTPPTPLNGTVPSIPLIEVDITEKGSGLRNDNMILTINNGPNLKNSLNITNQSTVDENGIPVIIYAIRYPYNQNTNGNYLIHFKAMDKANNPVEIDWNLTVDTDLPDNPAFFVTNGVNISYEPVDKLTFVSDVPVVTADYHVNPNKVEGIVQLTSSYVKLLATINQTPETIPTSCARIGSADRFNCTINISQLPRDGDYELTLRSVKNFSDGTASGIKTDVFSFVRDTEAPRVENFTIRPKYIRGDSDITFNAEIPNEKHRLKSFLKMADESGTVYQLYSNLSEIAENLQFGRVLNSAVLGSGIILWDGKNYTVRINVSDYGGNYNDSESDYLTVDDTPPLMSPYDIFINATPIYQYTFSGGVGGEGIIYIVRKDLVGISGTVPTDVVDLSIYRITGKGEYSVASLAPCSGTQGFNCVDNNTGRFVMTPRNTTVYGELGKVINNLIRIVATDRAGNKAEVTKLIYKDLETPAIIICTSVECTGTIAEETPPIIDAGEMKTFCGSDSTCYDMLIRGACTENGFLDPLCYSEYIAKKLRDPTLYILCLSDAIGIYSDDCIYDLAVNSCNTKVCENLPDLQFRIDCRNKALTAIC